MNAIVTYSPDQMALIKRTVAQGATDDELKLFLYDCERRNIHPLDKLLHFTKRQGRYVPITSIDLMRSRAAETGLMAGSEDAVFVYEDDEYPAMATVTVYRLSNRGDRFAYTATARWSEYHPGNSPMWKKMPCTMLAKCAEALALRKAFPQELAGLYAKEEMDQADAPVQRAAPKIGPNVLIEHNPALSQPDAAECVTAPQQEPVVAEGGGGLPIDREAFRAGVESATAPMPPIATEGFQVAQKGMAQLERWWVGLSKSEQKQLVPYKDALKNSAADYDALDDLTAQ